MKVVILCGGLGSRIRDVSEAVPKPMIPIGRSPIVWHIMQYYASYGFKDFVLCLGYKKEVIRDFFHNYRANVQDSTVVLGSGGAVEYHGEPPASGWRVTLADTGPNAMTGARVRRIRNYIGEDEHFMLTYGDGVGNVDLTRLIAFHHASGRVLTVTGVRPPGRFGEVVYQQDGAVTEFNEKPQATAGRISGGFFVCRRQLFDYLDDRENLVFEQEPMTRLVADRQLQLFEHDGFWQPMDTARDYELLNGLYAAGKAPWVR